MSKTTTKNKIKTTSATFSTWEDMPLDEFERRAERVKAAAAEFIALTERELPGLVTLTADQRARAPKLQEGEHAMLARVLDVADLKPALFESLADEDDGMDPQKFETGLLRERIEKHRLFREIAEELAPLSTQVNDSAHYLASRFREALSAAYRIAKTHAATDKSVNDLLAPAIDFMRKRALLGAATRLKNSKDDKGE